MIKVNEILFKLGHILGEIEVLAIAIKCDGVQSSFCLLHQEFHHVGSKVEGNES